MVSRRYSFIYLIISYTGIFLNEWRAAINTEARNSSEAALIFTAAVSGSPGVNDSIYVVQSLARNLDWINLLAYGFYGPNWSPSQTNSHAQLFDPVNGVSGSDGLNQWIQKGISPQKIVFGIPFFGYAWRLNNTNIHGLRAPATGRSNVYDGPWMIYDKIRDFIVQHRATTVHDDEIVGDYCYSGNTWISYDDIQSVRTKVSYIKSRGLLGYYAMDISGDTNWNFVLSHAASQGIN